ncbi:MAG: hypothetical protein ABIG11_07260 [bacterium]
MNTKLLITVSTYHLINAVSVVHRQLLLLILAILLPLSAMAQEEGEEKRSWFEPEIDPYYTSMGYYRTLTSSPVENLGEKEEWEIYPELLKRFYKPRTLVLELSVNPMPCLGTVIKKDSPDFYSRMHAGESFNLVQAVTAGFEEPWAVSLFLGNVVQFESIKKTYLGKRHGYGGLLIDAGNFHIKENVMVHDNWFQTELKIKGEQLIQERALKWSFRVGFKYHDNRDIADALFLGFRRSRTDFKESGNSFLNNSGFEYTFDIAQKNFEPLRHYFIVDKKFPLKNRRFAFSLGAGFVWTSGKKYSGSLKKSGKSGSDLQILIRPNVEF